jgi:hypothetical protein
LAATTWLIIAANDGASCSTPHTSAHSVNKQPRRRRRRHDDDDDRE